MNTGTGSPDREPLRQWREKAGTIERPGERLNPLLFACRCGSGAGCLACARWARHHAILAARRALWQAYQAQSAST